MHGARVIYDKECRRPRGFGFVYFADPQAARLAIQCLDRKPWHGKVLKVEYVRNPIALA
jgi:RNA recognition motif-containing protein